jgi:hypothetical protein
MTDRKKPTRPVRRPKKAARRQPAKALTSIDAAELAEATAEFDEEFVADSFDEPNRRQKGKLARAKRKRGRPKTGKGAKVISVSIERELLAKTDRLAKRLKVPRTTLISRGLEAVLDGEVPVAK